MYRTSSTDVMNHKKQNQNISIISITCTHKQIKQIQKETFIIKQN
jgi:hypothetical protein